MIEQAQSPTGASAHSAPAEREQQDDRGRIEIALDAAEMGVWEWRLADNHVTWSPAVERIHGLAPGTFDGSRERQAEDLHPEDREMVQRQIQRTLEERAPLRMTYRIIRPDGATRWLEANGQLVLDARGQPERLIGIVRDVTERREADTVRVRMLAAEVARADSERQREKLASIFEGITDPFVALDDELRVVQANRAAHALARARPGELEGKPAGEVNYLRGTSLQCVVERALERREAGVAEYHHPELDRWLESNAFPFADGVSIITRDVTLKKSALELTSRLARHSSLRADIAIALAEERELRPMLQRCCELVVRHLGVAFARLWTLDDEGTTLLLQASAGMYTHTDGPHRAVPVGKFKIGLIA